MAGKNFTYGDVVQLKSGGPAMTVTVPYTPDRRSTFGKMIGVMPDWGAFGVKCQWFDARDNLQDGRFHPDHLVFIPPTKSET